MDRKGIIHVIIQSSLTVRKEYGIVFKQAVPVFEPDPTFSGELDFILE